MHHAPPLIRPPKPKQKPTLREIGPYTYEVWNYDGPVFNAVRDLYAVGGTQSKYRPGPMDTISLQKSRARSRDYWVKSNEPKITLWMDQSQVIPRTRINRRAPGVYDAVRAIFRDQHRIPQGVYSMRSLANGPLKGKLDVVGYANQERLPENDTAEGGKVYWSIPLMQNPGLGGVIGSYRTYLDDSTTVTQGRQARQGRQGTHIMAYENLADDNWDYTSDSELAQVYNFFCKRAG